MKNTENTYDLGHSEPGLSVHHKKAHEENVVKRPDTHVHGSVYLQGELLLPLFADFYQIFKHLPE